MSPGRLVRAGTPLEVSILAAIALVLGVGSLVSAAFPMADDAPRILIASLGIMGVSIAAALLRGGPRVPLRALHLTVVLLVSMRCVMVAAAVTERGLMLAALGFVWMAVYVAFFLEPSAARSYAALMTASLGLSMLLARAPTDVSVWITISAMVWVSIVLLTKVNTRLRSEAHTDDLTGLLNRTGFALAAARHRAMAARRGESLAVAVIDLDAFKIVNDREGHAAGDRLLVELAGAWTGSLRPGDLLARFGGDEFVLMFPVVEEEQMELVLARLAGAHRAPWTAGSVICTADESLDEAINRADERLYLAKGYVRNSTGWGRMASALRDLQPGPA